jgi:hypothetical protein
MEPLIYFVLSDTKEVLYVGQSIRPKERWKFHVLLPELRSRSRPLSIAYLCCAPEHLHQREQEFLARYAPPLNHPHSIMAATEPEKRLWPFITRAQIPMLPIKDRIYAESQFEYWSPFIHSQESDAHKNHADFMVICTHCFEKVWCHACVPWECDCWKEGRWTLLSIETYDALHLGIDRWLAAHPALRWWDFDTHAQRYGATKGQVVAFKIGLHQPTPWDATVLAKALGTTLPALARQRLDVLEERQQHGNSDPTQ